MKRKREWIIFVQKDTSLFFIHSLVVIFLNHSFKIVLSFSLLCPDKIFLCVLSDVFSKTHTLIQLIETVPISWEIKTCYIYALVGKLIIIDKVCKFCAMYLSRNFIAKNMTMQHMTRYVYRSKFLLFFFISKSISKFNSIYFQIYARSSICRFAYSKESLSLISLFSSPLLNLLLKLSKYSILPALTNAARPSLEEQIRWETTVD